MVSCRSLPIASPALCCVNVCVCFNNNQQEKCVKLSGEKSGHDEPSHTKFSNARPNRIISLKQLKCTNSKVFLTSPYAYAVYRTHYKVYNVQCTSTSSKLDDGYWKRADVDRHSTGIAPFAL